MGMIVLCVLPMSTWAGFLPSMGVLRSCNKAKYGSLLLRLAFSNVFFTVCIVRSMNPLLCGYLGLVVSLENPQVAAKILNSSAINYGPLSLTTMSGIPCLATNDFALLITVDDDVLCK